MIKIAICDDKAVMCDLLRKKVAIKLEEWNESFQITCYGNAAELLNSPMDFSIIFLDIQMPGLDGVELAKRLRKQELDTAIIFVTVLKDCMLDAFEVEAIDYICKPVDEGRLEGALKRALKRIKKEEGQALFIRTAKWCKSIKIDTIYYCEVINRKIYLHTKTGVIDYYGKMEEVERQLDHRFIKCHRSYLVNLDYIKEYKKGQIIMENGEQAPVSRLRHQEIMEAMLHYMQRGD